MYSSLRRVDTKYREMFRLISSASINVFRFRQLAVTGTLLGSRLSVGCIHFQVPTSN